MWATISFCTHAAMCMKLVHSPSCIIMSLWCMSASLEPMQAFRSRFCLAALEKKWRFLSKAVRQNLEQKAWVRGYECHCRTIISYCNVCEWPYWSSGILNLWNGSVITFQYIIATSAMLGSLGWQWYCHRLGACHRSGACHWRKVLLSKQEVRFVYSKWVRLVLHNEV